MHCRLQVRTPPGPRFFEATEAHPCNGGKPIPNFVFETDPRPANLDALVQLSRTSASESPPPDPETAKMSLNNYLESESDPEHNPLFSRDYGPLPRPPLLYPSGRRELTRDIRERTERVCIITTDGRNLVGELISHDNTTNLVRWNAFLPSTTRVCRANLYVSADLEKHGRARDSQPRRRGGVERSRAGALRRARRYRMRRGPGG